MNVPIPGVPYQVASAGRAGQAPSVAPVQDATGEQQARLGGALFEAGAAVSRRADYQQDLLDDAMTTELDNLTADAIDKRLYDPKTGYMNLTGRDATGDARKAFETDLDKEIEEIGKKATNAVQREQWARMVRDRRRNASAQANRHEAAQTEVFLVGVTKARRDTARRDAARPDATPAQRERQKKLMTYATESLVRMAGGSEEEASAAVLEQMTILTETMVRDSVDQDPQKAKKILDQAKKANEVNPERVGVLDDLVRNGVDTERAAIEADEILTGSVNQYAAEQTALQRWRDSQKTANPMPARVLDKIIGYMRDRSNAAQAQLDNVNNRLLDEAETQFRANGIVSPSVETAIKTAGLEAKFQIIKAGGRTNDFGYNMLWGMSDEQWLMIPDAASVLALGSTVLSKDDRRIAVAKWHDAQARHGRAVKDARDEAAKQRDAFAVQKEEMARYYFGKHRGVPMEKDEPAAEVAKLTEYKIELFKRASMLAAGEKKKVGSGDDLEQAAASMKREAETIQKPIMSRAAPEDFQKDLEAIMRLEAKFPGKRPTMAQFEEERAKIKTVMNYDEWARQLRSEATAQVYKDLEKNNKPETDITDDLVTDKMEAIVNAMSVMVTSLPVENHAEGMRAFEEQSNQSLHSSYVMEKADEYPEGEPDEWTKEYERRQGIRNFATETFQAFGILKRPKTRSEFLIELLVANGKKHRDTYGITEEEQREMATRLVRGVK